MSISNHSRALGLLRGLLLALPVQAMQVGVAAVVNDQIISTVELDERTDLFLANIGLPDSPATRAELEPRILRMLVEEKLLLKKKRLLST